MPGDPHDGLETFSRAGLYDRSSPRESERRELLEHLVERGFEPDRIVAAAARTIPVYLAAALARVAPELVSLRDVAVRADVDLELVVRLRRSFGFRVTDPDTVDVVADFIDTARVFKFGCDEFGQDAALTFARVIGSSVGRMVEAARAMFSAGMRTASASELEVSQRNEIANAAWTEVNEAIGSLIRERLSYDTDFTESLLRNDLRVAVAFVDLVGSTEWAETAASEGQMARALAEFEREAFDLAGVHATRLVKMIGDEAMLVAQDPSEVCEVAVQLCAYAREHPSLPSARGAVGSGAVVAMAGDYFGPVVNLVARATKCAEPGHVVVTRAVRNSLDPSKWLFEPKEPAALRGIPEPVALWGIRHNA